MVVELKGCPPKSPRPARPATRRFSTCSAALESRTEIRRSISRPIDTAARFNAAGAQTNPTFGHYPAHAAPRRMVLAAKIWF